MLDSTRALAVYLTVVSLAVAPRACEAVTDDQSDDGSARLFLSGNGQRAFTADDKLFYGTYKVRATEPQAQANCRWQTFTLQHGHWVQESPKAVGTWNHLSDLFHRGHVKINKPMLFVSKGCPKWEARR